ncbi:hypothetical protein QTN25_003732 [Entamoeba marina]
MSSASRLPHKQNFFSKPPKSPKSTTADSKTSKFKKKAKPRNCATNSQEYRENGNGQKLIWVKFAKFLGVEVELLISSRKRKNGETNIKIKQIKFPDGFNIAEHLDVCTELQQNYLRLINWTNIGNDVNEKILKEEVKRIAMSTETKVSSNGTPNKRSDSVQNIFTQLLICFVLSKYPEYTKCLKEKQSEFTSCFSFSKLEKDKIQEMKNMVHNLQTNTNNSNSSGIWQPTSVNSCFDKPPETTQDDSPPLIHDSDPSSYVQGQQESVIQLSDNSCSNKSLETTQDDSTPFMANFGQNDSSSYDQDQQESFIQPYCQEILFEHYVIPTIIIY